MDGLFANVSVFTLDIEKSYREGHEETEEKVRRCEEKWL